MSVTKTEIEPPKKVDTGEDGVPDGAADEESHAGYGGTDRLKSEIGPLEGSK